MTTKYVVTTEGFRRGQAAAWKDHEKDPDSMPNRVILARVSDEFRAGYLSEFDDFILPAQQRARRSQ